ncbi:craniofacial development protein 2-like [Topomyia yanbarensis]|uniref:craniofacial development protein 2-like n=1 Tax=Topomyia yanbarensis TaxID=2498891 RepID=UPI00273BD032|nr:craniofacial development protein 2-like [Topomyia yanbarensis]
MKGRFFNFSIINVHSPPTGSADHDKDAFYAQLEYDYNICPSYDVKIRIGDLNAQVDQEEEFRPTIGKFSAHLLTNYNGLRLIDFAASKNMAIRSYFFQHNIPCKHIWRSPQQTESQIHHVLIDGRHFSDIIDVRTYRGANIDSDHLVRVKLCPKLQVATTYAQNLEAALPYEGALYGASLEDCWNVIKAAKNTAESVVGYVERSMERLVRREV